MNDAAKEFFDSLPSENEVEKEYDIFEEHTPEKEETKVEAPAEQVEDSTPEERKKPLRSERRAEKQREYYEGQLREEREARIRLEEQVKALASKPDEEIDTDIQKLLYEVKDPAEGTKIFAKLLARAEENAEARAIARLQEIQSSSSEEVNNLASEIEDNIESIEEKYGVDLTDDTDTRNAFLDFVESIAPPGSDDLPNMQNAWVLFQKTRTAPTSNVERKKEIASRGIVRSNGAPKPEAKDLRPVGFELLNGDMWSKIIGKS